MGSKSDAYEADILKAATGQATSILTTTPFAHVDVALFTVNPTDSTAGTEVVGGSYARVDSIGKWGAPSGTTQIANNAVITFPTVTVAWGAVTGFGLFDRASGTLLYWGALGTTRSPLVGDTPQFAVGTLILTED